MPPAPSSLCDSVYFYKWTLTERKKRKKQKWNVVVMLTEDVTSWCTVAVLSWRQISFSASQKQQNGEKKKKKATKGKQPGSGAAYRYVLVSSACQCVTVSSGYIVSISHLDRTGRCRVGIIPTSCQKHAFLVGSCSTGTPRLDFLFIPTRTFCRGEGHAVTRPPYDTTRVLLQRELLN